MNIKLGRHYLADFYLCQNKLWEDSLQLATEIAKALGPNGFNWVVRTATPQVILISGEFEATFILIQMFSEQKFLALDFFTWNPDFNLAHYSEVLIELLAPQVVAAETRFRAEHLN
jgi:S-adenosylmethionine/arginine decarboxylase-like enzyme